MTFKFYTDYMSLGYQVDRSLHLFISYHMTWSVKQSGVTCCVVLVAGNQYLKKFIHCTLILKNNTVN